MKHKGKQTAQRSEPMAKRVPFFDMQYEMNNGYVHRGYVHWPRYGDGKPMGFASGEREPSNCAVLYSQWQRIRECNLDSNEVRCKVKCALCKLVGHTNDYMRGFQQDGRGKRTAAQPHYPVPSVHLAGDALTFADTVTTVIALRVDGTFYRYPEDME